MSQAAVCRAVQKGKTVRWAFRTAFAKTHFPRPSGFPNGRGQSVRLRNLIIGKENETWEFFQS